MKKNKQAESLDIKVIGLFCFCVGINFILWFFTKVATRSILTMVVFLQ